MNTKKDKAKTLLRIFQGENICKHEQKEIWLGAREIKAQDVGDEKS